MAISANCTSVFTNFTLTDIFAGNYDAGYLSKGNVTLTEVFWRCVQTIKCTDQSGSYNYPQSAEDENYIDRTCGQADTMKHIFFTTALVVGIPANILALAAMLTLRPRSIGSFYVALLAAADLTALVMRGVDHAIVTLHVDTPRLVCGFKVTLLMFFQCYANWVLVLICFERFYTLRFPLSKAAHFTFHRARLLAAGVALVLFAYFLAQMFLQGEPYSGWCEIEDRDIAYWMGKVDDCVYFYIPSVLLFIFVTLIARELHVAQKARRRMFTSDSLRGRSASDAANSAGSGCATGGGNNGGNPQTKLISGQFANNPAARQLRQQEKNENSLTIMMLCAAVFFLVMTIPMCIVLQLYFEPQIGPKAADWVFHFIWAQGVNTITHVANFFVYFLTCRRMRIHLVRMFDPKGVLQRWCARACACCTCCGDDRRFSVSTADTALTKTTIFENET